MTTEQLLLALSSLVMAWLGYLQVKGKNQGDAIQATSQSVIALSKRVDELEKEKKMLSDELQKVKDSAEEDQNESKQQIALLIIDRDNLRRQVSDTSERLTVQGREIKTQQEMINNQRDQIAALVSQLTDKDRTISQMSKEISRLNSQVVLLTARLKKYEEVK